MQTSIVKRGQAPLVISFPHVGTWLPAAIADRMTPIARHLPDTDWHVDRLYACAEDLDATVVTATHSRYVVDLNRATDERVLYPGEDTSELVPLTTFDHEEIYLPGQRPDSRAIEERIALYWKPWHDTLSGEIARLQKHRRQIVLLDGHSIRSEVPRLFDGRLADFNVGTADGAAAHPELLERVVAPLTAQNAFSIAINGRFKGGYITRHYGNPSQGVHAIQLELSQAIYMEEILPLRWRDDSARRVCDIITRYVTAALDWINGNTGSSIPLQDHSRSETSGVSER